MTPDPADFHRALLARPRGRSRHPAPAAALVLLVTPATGVVLGQGVLTADLTRMVALGTVGALGLLVLALARLPEDAPRGADGVRTPALLAERVLLLAASASAAAELLTAVGPALPRPLVAAVLVVLALAGRLTLAHPVRRRWTAGLGVLAAVVLALVVAAGAGAAAGGGLPEPPEPAGTGAALTQLLALGGALAVTGAVLQPAVLLPARRGLPRAAAAGATVALVVALLGAGLVPGSGPLEVTSAGLGGWAAPGVAVLLAGGLLAAGTSALSGLPRPPATWPASRRWPAGAAGRRLSTAVAAVALVVVLLAGQQPWRLVACYAAVVLLLTLLAFLAGREEWHRRLEILYRPAGRRAARRSRALTAPGTVVCAALLLLAAPRGWPALLAVAAGSAMMWGVSRHDSELRARLALDHAAEDRPLPTVVRAFVVVTELDRPAVRAVSYARAMRATSVEALTVPGDDEAAAALRRQWATLDLPVPLVELAAPPGDTGAAVVAHVAAARRAEPDGLAVVYLPETTARRRWRRLLLGSGPQRLRTRLLALPGTVVTTVPWPTEES